MLIFSSKTYDFLKRCVQVFLPGVSALYFGLSQIWGFPYGEKIVGTLALLTTFLGLCLGISSKTYRESEEFIQANYDGALVVTNPKQGERLVTLDVHLDPDEMIKKDKVTLKVKKAKR